VKFLQHYALAVDWVSRSELALRSLDALHLAIAVTETAVLGTADRQLSHAAKRLKVETVPL